MFVSVEVTFVPPNVNQTYKPFNYGIYGLGCWVYKTATDGDFHGQIEWINMQRWRSSAPGAGAKYFRVHLVPGVRATIKAQLEIPGASPDVLIDAVLTNLLSGKNIPPVFP